MNILKVKFGKATRVESKPLYQYDYGQILKIIDLDLPAAYEVHFSNYERGDAYVTLAQSNEIAIPDTLLQTGLNIYVWIYIHTDISDGETEYQIIIPVIQRAKPIDEEPTTEQQSVIENIIAALNSALTESREGVQSVERMANNVQNQYNLVEAAKNKTYEYKEEARTAASLLENVTANATTLSFEEQATASYSNGVFNFGIPTGPQGKKGDKGDTGYGVPIVTTADNGKFLRVVDGTWVADTIPSASGVNF